MMLRFYPSEGVPGFLVSLKHHAQSGSTSCVPLPRAAYHENATGLQRRQKAITVTWSSGPCAGSGPGRPSESVAGGRSGSLTAAHVGGPREGSTGRQGLGRGAPRRRRAGAGARGLSGGGMTGLALLGSRTTPDAHSQLRPGAGPSALLSLFLALWSREDGAPH